MTQWVKSLAANPDNLNLMPGTHEAEGENEWSPQSCPLASTCLSTQKHTEHRHNPNVKEDENEKNLTDK